MKKIGIVGAGAIGSFFARSVNDKFKSLARIVAICDTNTDAAKKLSSSLPGKPQVLPLDKLIVKSDLIIEAASPAVSAKVCKAALTKGKDVLIMSIGGLLTSYKSLFELAKKKKATIVLPSGAICGLDGIKAASIGKIQRVSLTTRKPPKGLKGAPFIIKNRIDLDSVDKEQVIFNGTANDAVKAFPKNINVSALLSIAALGPKKTKVKIITSPEYMVNSHEIEVEGDFGRLITKTENVPSPENPKTSFLAPLSAVAALRELLEPSRKIGT